MLNRLLSGDMSTDALHRSALQFTANCLVPKLHLGTRLRAKLYFGRGGAFGVGSQETVNSPLLAWLKVNEAQFRGHGRSQVQLGNEGEEQSRNRAAEGEPVAAALEDTPCRRTLERGGDRREKASLFQACGIN